MVSNTKSSCRAMYSAMCIAQNVLFTRMFFPSQLIYIQVNQYLGILCCSMNGANLHLIRSLGTISKGLDHLRLCDSCVFNIGVNVLFIKDHSKKWIIAFICSKNISWIHSQLRFEWILTTRTIIIIVWTIYTKLCINCVYK